MASCRAELVLAELASENSVRGLYLKDVTQLKLHMEKHGLQRKHAQLWSLLCLLENRLGEIENSTKEEASMASLPPLPSAISLNHLSTDMDKQGFIAALKDICKVNMTEGLCSSLLQHLDQSEILSLMMTRDFEMQLLAECIRVGASYKNLGKDAAVDSRRVLFLASAEGEFRDQGDNVKKEYY
jgi:hypothetical protein